MDASDKRIVDPTTGKPFATRPVLWVEWSRATGTLIGVGTCLAALTAVWTSTYPDVGAGWTAVALVAWLFVWLGFGMSLRQGWIVRVGGGLLLAIVIVFSIFLSVHLFVAAARFRTAR